MTYFMNRISNFYSCYLATLIHKLAFKPDMDFQAFIQAMPLSSELISINITDDLSVVQIAGKVKATLIIEHSADMQTALVKLNPASIKIVADEADNYELECFLLDHCLLDELFDQAVMLALLQWYEDS